MINLLWLFMGGLYSCMSLASLWYTVGKLQPQGNQKNLALFVSGFLLRLILAGVLFFFAIQHGLLAILYAMGGMLVTQWLLLIWINILGKSGNQRIWSWRM